MYFLSSFIFYFKRLSMPMEVNLGSVHKLFHKLIPINFLGTTINSKSLHAYKLFLTVSDDKPNMLFVNISRIL